VLTIGRFPGFSLGFDQQSHLAHQTMHPFLVDVPPLAMQLFGDSAVAVGRPFGNYILDSALDLVLVLQLGLVVVAAPGAPEQITQQAHRIVVGQHLDHLPFPLK
jgi:hypothetical protein